MRQTKRALLISIVVMLVCLCMFTSTTWAWFTDEVTSAENKIQAGNLKVDLELLDKETGIWNSLKESKAPIFNYDRWEPGYVDAKILKIENEGSLALKWVAKFYSKNQLSALADVIDVYVLPSATELDYPTRSLEGYTCVGNLRSFINSIEETTYGSLEADQVAYLGIALKMRESAGNEYQGLSLCGTFDIRVLATQYSSEYDSFGNQYDKDATFEDFADTSVLESLTKTISPEDDELVFNLYYKTRRIAKVIVPKSAIKDTTKPVNVTIKGIDPTASVIEDENTQAYAYDINVTNLKDNLKGNQLVTVIVAAPNALAAMNAYHNGKLIENAVYDEVEGTITFKTASFSPYDFTSKVVGVETLDELRKALSEYGTTAKLMDNIVVDLTKDTGAARNDDHSYKGSKTTYYNGVKIAAEDVGLDLNGHSITVFCGDKYNSNSDVGALFFIDKQGSLNITNTGDVSTGFIKMASSIYAVWAPFEDPSYVDIYGGAFIADWYAGDEVGTPVDANGKYDPTTGNMKNENSNRALIYAGFGGNINVYGGYFLYNNTPNDVKNRNNGAFNAKDFYEGEKPLITIHEGVMLSNNEYRQNPDNTSQPNGSYDNHSVKLVDETLYKVSETVLEEAIEIAGTKYKTWYKVTRAFKYMITFKDENLDTDNETLDTKYIKEDGTIVIDKIDDTARGKLSDSYQDDFGGWVNAASEHITSIPDDNTKDIILYPKHQNKYTVRWLDENGNVINSVSTTQTTYGNLSKSAPQNPKSQYDNMEFSYWEIRTKNDDGKPTYNKIEKDYNISADITLYPYYDYKEANGSIILRGHDDDGDGRYDWYSVEAATGLSGEVTIPGNINGAPVSVITDLSNDTLNYKVMSVIIKDGVEKIGSKAFAMTSKLNYVEVPASVKSIGANAFSSVLGGIADKQVTIKYDGTWEDWQKICAENWDSGLVNGSRVICTDGEYVLNDPEKITILFIPYPDPDHDWPDWKKQ